MTWTTEMPQRPGWYWWRSKKGVTSFKYIQETGMVCHHKGKTTHFSVPTAHDDDNPESGGISPSLMDAGEWAGPLAPPEEG